MQVVAEKERILKILKTALLYKGNASIEMTKAVATNNGLVINDASLTIMGIYLLYPKSYFIDLQAKEGEELPLTKTMLQYVKKGFKQDAVLTITTDNDKVYVVSEDSKYWEPIPEINNQTISKLKVEKREQGYIDIVSGFEVEFKTAISVELAELEQVLNFSAEEYKFEFDGKNLNVSFSDIGEYTKTIKAKVLDKNKSEKVTIVLNGKFLRRILSNITTEKVVLLLSDNIAVFEVIQPEYINLFFMAGIMFSEEGEEASSEIEEVVDELDEMVEEVL